MSDGPSPTTMSQTMVREPETVTAAVVEKLADAEGVGVYDVAPLVESVDPDALEALFDEGTADDVFVEFSHEGYRVTIDGGDVTVEPADDGA